jgi:hypothetical protein
MGVCQNSLHTSSGFLSGGFFHGLNHIFDSFIYFPFPFCIYRLQRYASTCISQALTYLRNRAVLLLNKLKDKKTNLGLSIVNYANVLFCGVLVSLPAMQEGLHRLSHVIYSFQGKTGVVLLPIETPDSPTITIPYIEDM